MRSYHDRNAPHLPVVTVCENARSLGEIFRRRAEATPDKPAHFQKEDGVWHKTSWRAFYAASKAIAAGLIERGLEPGERVSILGPTRQEWGVCDLGAQLAGLVTIGIYPKQTAEQVHYILEHSETRAMFVADQLELDTVLQAAEQLPDLRYIITWTDELATANRDRCDRLVSIQALSGSAISDSDLEERLSHISPDDTAILIYTSGTTGPPKGAMITHANIISVLQNYHHIFQYYQDDLTVSFLPMAHASERNGGFYARINTGTPTAYATSIAAVLLELQEIRPTVFGSVPRLFEKAHARIFSELAKKPPFLQKIFRQAEQTGREWFRGRETGEQPGLMQRLQFGLADRIIFKKIRDAFGGRVRAMVTGAAPISRDILEFYWAIGLPLYEGYGMTEATIITHINTVKDYRLGTVVRWSLP